MDESTVRPISTHIREMLTMLEKASACTDDSRVSKSHLVKNRKRKRKDILYLYIFYLSLRIFLDTAPPLILSVMMEFIQTNLSFLTEVIPPPNG